LIAAPQTIKAPATPRLPSPSFGAARPGILPGKGAGREIADSRGAFEEGRNERPNTQTLISELGNQNRPLPPVVIHELPGVPAKNGDSENRAPMRLRQGHDFSQFAIHAQTPSGIPTTHHRSPVSSTPAASPATWQHCPAPVDSSLAIQLASDPSPPPGLTLDPHARPAAGGDPIMDDGSAAAGMGAEQKQGPEDGQKAPPVQAASQNTQFRTDRQAALNHIRSGLSGGSPLGPGIHGVMSTFFRKDLSAVRVHTSARASAMARSLNAHAFTLGNQIAFADGRFCPGRTEGQRLIAHELTHVLQQRRGLDSEIRRAGIGEPGDRYEVEAEQNADRFVRGNQSDFRGKDAAEPAGAGDTLQLYSASTAAAYARTWALGTNPLYPRDGNDCTNFVSQAVLAGGWTMAGGSCDDRKSDSAWWHGDSQCWHPGVHRSYTWGGAQNFFNFLVTSGRGKAAANVSDLDVGDVLQVAHGGHVGHSTIVTGKAGANLLVSYHTNDTLDLNVWGSGGFLERESNPKNTFFAWKL